MKVLRSTPLSSLLLMVLMALSAVAGSAMRPTHMLADELPALDLQTVVPARFGDWTVQELYSAPVINPQQQDLLERIYSQTLSRTYVNSQGYRIMLSIAYGRNQSKSLELHSPEVCYPAQGFTVLHKDSTSFSLLGKSVDGFHLETRMGQRHEPISYWNVIGSHISTSLLDKRLVDLGYSVRGRIADGVLMRVSSIDNDTAHAYEVQSQFSNALLQSISPMYQERFVGTLQAR